MLFDFGFGFWFLVFVFSVLFCFLERKMLLQTVRRLAERHKAEKPANHIGGKISPSD